MTNKPKASQNNSEKHPLPSQQHELPLPAEHIITPAQGTLLSYLFKGCQTQSAHRTHTRPWANKGCRRGFEGFSNVCAHQTADRRVQRHLRWARCLVCVTVQLSHSGNAEASSRRVLLRPPDPPGVDLPFNLHLKWETGHRCTGTGLWFVLWSLWNHASCRRGENIK